MLNNQDILGFEEQTDFYSCGAQAFSYAMTLYGIPMTISDSKKAVNTISPLKAIMNLSLDFGTDEDGIKKAIKKAGFIPKVFEVATDGEAQKNIDNYMAKNIPIIISVGDNWDHWAMLGGKIKNRYIVFDSGPEDYVVSEYTWKDLKEYLGWVCEDCAFFDDDDIGKQWCQECDGTGDKECSWCEGDGCGHCKDRGYRPCSDCDGLGYFDCETCGGEVYGYSGIAVVPPSGYKGYHAYKHFDIFIDDLLENETLQEYWGFYLSHLMDLFGEIVSSRGGILVEDIISANYYELINEIGYYCDIDEDIVEAELCNIMIVARAYKFKVKRSDENRVLIAIRLLLYDIVNEYYFWFI